MAGEAKFSENGLKLIGAVATFAAAGPPGITVASVIAAAGFVMFVVNMMTNDTTVEDALKSLQKQIEEIKAAITALDQRLDELVQQVAIESNRQTLARLNDQLDSIRIQAIRLLDQPQDIDTAVEVANELGVIIDKFLRADFEIWRWTDVVEKNGQPALEIGRFKNVPTLPVYLVGVLTWLTARERVVQANQRSRLDDDAGRISRHLGAVSVRGNFDKYRDDDAGRPTTIAENMKWRVRAFPIASNKFAENRTCHFFYEVHNWMNGNHTRGDNFDIITDSDGVLCTVDPFSLGAPNLELDWEIEAGVELMRLLATILGRVEATGTIREPFVGQFPTGQVFPPTVLYVIAQNGEIHWYRNDSSSQPGGSTKWAGPATIGTGAQGFTTFFNGGGEAMYGIQRDGTLLWFGYSGFVDGSNTWLNDAQPIQVATGWDSFKSVFPGGESIIYGILPDGELVWHRHDGAGSGSSNWTGPVHVASGWGDFRKVFSGGEGVIYAIDLNDTLFRVVHKGYRTGTAEWETDSMVPIAEGWGFFSDGIASSAADGVIYGFRRDGRVFYMRFAERRPEPAESQPSGGLGGILNPPPVFVPGLPPPLFWEGPPVEIKHDLPGFLSVFPQMNKPSFSGPS